MTSEWVTTEDTGGGTVFCHCNWVTTCTTNAPFLAGGSGMSQSQVNCWMRCGDFYAPYGVGGQGAMTTYCERCCGQGGTGGSGVVKNYIHIRTRIHNGKLFKL